MSFWVDLLLIVIFALVVFLAVKRGFVKSILSVAAWFISFLFASEVCSPVAAFLYHNFFSNRVSAFIEQRLPETLNDDSAIYYAERVAENIPEFLKRAAMSINVDIDSLANYFRTSVDSKAGLAQDLTDRLAYPLCTALLSAAIFFATFFVMIFIARFIVNAVSGLIKFSILGTPDAILGGALGLIKGALLIVVLAIAARILAEVWGSPSIIEAVNSSRIVGMIRDSHLLTNMFAS